jgi:hypothetical protein
MRFTPIFIRGHISAGLHEMSENVEMTWEDF